MTYLDARGAYGRTYKSAKAIKADWAAGKDFVIVTIGRWDGKYINKADAKGITLNVRYNDDRDVAVVKG